MSKSELEALLGFQMRAAGLPTPKREYVFHNTRKWRFDFAWPDRMLAAEVEGGVYRQGRHTRGSGFVNDCEKLNEAALLGWRVLRLPGPWVGSGEALEWIERGLNGKT